MRVLLPAEIELCKAVGLTEQEYWDFVKLNEAYNGERSEAYAHIPDVRNDPVITPIVVNLVIGIALTAVASLLAPKPRAPEEKEKPQLKTGDQTSQSRYAPQSNFDSLQQLATLGSVIPLVYCKYDETTKKGGVRVNSTLLWSHMISLGRSTQLRALMLFSNGAIKTRPDFEGYAIGDLLVNNYAQGKIALYFKNNGGRFNQGETYDKGLMDEPYSGTTDPFAFKWGNDLVQYFSGARTPGTQAVFGNYLAMPNGNRYKVNYELLLKIDGIDGDVEDDIRNRQRKIRDWFPRYCYIFGPGDANEKPVNVGDTIQYALAKDTWTAQIYGSNGIVDINQALNNARIAIDGALVVGETYLIGTCLAVCVDKTGSPWTPASQPNASQVTAFFRVTTKGVIDTRDGNRAGRPDNLTIQRVAIATISNNRACNRTDLIIKSTVWRKINGFTNVNTQPTQATIKRYEEEDGSINLGQMNIYNKRQSFFGLEYRLQGTDTWTNITPENTGFVVEGSTPEAVYNQICIYHPNTNAYDFRLTPISGNAVARFWGDPGREVNMYFLDAAGEYEPRWKQPKQNAFTKNGFVVYYTGRRKLFRRDEGSNKEWEIYGVPVDEGDDYYGEVDQSGQTVNLRYGDAYQDYIIYEAEELSNATAPEHEVVSVNEFLQTSAPAQYTNLAYAGIRLNSGAEWTSFSELSAYFKDGILVPKLKGINTGSELDSTNLLPEIAYDLLTNLLFGAGEVVGPTQVNAIEMTEAAKFCKANGFFWDGVIGERVNIREWIYEQAGYCLLQFRIKGGQFSLYPDVPFDSNGVMLPNAPISASAIFTDGTMSDLKVSFLSPEERQLFKATVLWRQDTINGFPQTRTVTVKLKAGSDNVPEETFDMSGFCTSEEHAVTFAKYALKVRQLVDHGISFKTTPQLAMKLEPGQYFQVATAVAHPRSTGRSADRFKNGSISSDGTITGLKLKDGKYQIQYWVPGTEGLRETNIDVKGGSVADVSLRGSVFAVATRNGTQTRMYKVESLTYAEDGLVEVAGSFTPLIGNRLAVLDWNGQFDPVISS